MEKYDKNDEENEKFEYHMPNFDTVRIKQFIEEHTNVNIVTYLITIVLYVISFTFLFRKDTTEYIVWILIFILNFVTPLLWSTDMFRLLDVLSGQMPEMNKNLFIYGLFGMVITSILTFIGILLVIMKNEDVRLIKKSEGHYNDTTEAPDLKTNIRGVEKTDRNIMILYTTVVTLIWGMVAFNFSEYLTGSAEKSKAYPFGSKIKAMMDVIPNILGYIDDLIHYYSQQIQLSPLLKCTAFYMVTFVVVLFGIFAKVNYFPTESTVGLREEIEIVNMSHLFTERFDIEFFRIKQFVIFVVGLLSTLLFGGAFDVIKSYFFGTNDSSSHLVFISMLIFGGICFPLLYSYQDTLFSKDRVKEIAFFFISIIFGMVAAPPIVAIVESVIGLFRSKGITFFTGSNYPMYMMIISSVLISSSIFIVGMTDDWIDQKGKHMKTLLALLVTMLISLFMGFSAEYRVFTNLFTGIGALLRIAMKFLAPITAMILSALIVYYANQNYKIVNNRARSVVAGEPPETSNTPTKTKNPIRDQKKIRNVLKSTIGDVTSYVASLYNR